MGIIYPQNHRLALKVPKRRTGLGFACPKTGGKRGKHHTFFRVMRFVRVVTLRGGGSLTAPLELSREINKFPTSPQNSSSQKRNCRKDVQYGARGLRFPRAGGASQQPGIFLFQPQPARALVAWGFKKIKIYIFGIKNKYKILK